MTKTSNSFSGERPFDPSWISPCPHCNCMTHSVRLGRAHYECGKCKGDKSLSDYMFWEATEKEKKVKKQ